jgi:hypothetical protein
MTAAMTTHPLPVARVTVRAEATGRLVAALGSMRRRAVGAMTVAMTTHPLPVARVTVQAEATGRLVAALGSMKRRAVGAMTAAMTTRRVYGVAEAIEQSRLDRGRVQSIRMRNLKLFVRPRGTLRVCARAPSLRKRRLGFVENGTTSSRPSSRAG